MDPCEIAERYLDSTGENSAPRRARSTKFSHAHSGQRNRDSNFHAVCACYHCSWIPLMMPTLRARFESHLGARIKPQTQPPCFARSYFPLSVMVPRISVPTRGSCERGGRLLFKVASSKVSPLVRTSICQ